MSICSALEKYVENGNFKSRRYLAKELLLNPLMSMVHTVLIILLLIAQKVGHGIGTEKILIALLKDDA